MKVRKAVIAVVASGMDMLPITSIVPKELLPVCGRPIIEHVVKEAAQAGIEEVVLVICKGKEAVAEYFRPNEKLKARLIKDGENDMLKELECIWNMVKVTTVYQDEQNGLGGAILAAKEVVGNEPFAVLHGDNIIHIDDCSSFTAHLMSAYEKYGRSVVGVQEVDPSLTSRHVIFDGKEFDNTMFNGNRVIDRPTENETGSNLAFCARYVFKPDIIQFLEQTKPDKNNQILLTDAMQQLLESDGLLGAKLEGEHYGIEDAKGLLLANLSMTEFGCD